MVELYSIRKSLTWKINVLFSLNRPENAFAGDKNIHITDTFDLKSTLSLTLLFQQVPDLWCEQYKPCCYHLVSTYQAMLVTLRFSPILVLDNFLASENCRCRKIGLYGPSVCLRCYSAITEKYRSGVMMAK